MYSPSPKVMDLLLDAICVVDAEGRFVYISAACERILGYSPAELIGRPMMELIHPDDLEATLRTAQDVMRGRQKNHFENRYIRKDGQIAHIMWSASWSEEEQLRVAVAHDISQRKHADAMQAGVYAISVAANRSEELTELFAEIHRIIAGLLPIGLFSLALRSDQEDNLNIPYFADLEHPQAPEVGEQTKALSRAIIERGQPILLTTETLDEEQLELLPLANRGAMNWLGVPLISPQGTFGALVIHGHSSSPRYTVKDRELLHFVSSQIAAAIQRLQLQSRLKHLSHHDQLTGLPNRTLLYDRLERSLARARRENSRVSLLYLDLDKFKQVNDQFGHGTGDQLLQAVATRLLECVREVDTVSRIGGDEFVILLEDIQAEEHVLLVAEKIRQGLNQPFQLGEHQLLMIPSIGIALYPDHAQEQEQLLSMADKAMYLAKQNGGNRFTIAGASPVDN